MHDEDRFYADAAHTGGMYFLGPGDMVDSLTATPVVVTRNGAQSWSLNRTAAGAETHFIRPANDSLRRLAEAIALQQQFGGSVGPLPAPGRPPFTGASQLVPPTSSSPVNKGNQILDITLAYSITVVNLTTNALTLNTATFANNTAIVGGTRTLTGTLATATQAQPYVTKITVNTPVFDVTDLQDVWPELQVVMANTGVYQLFGMWIHCNMNYD